MGLPLERSQRTLLGQTFRFHEGLQSDTPLALGMQWFFQRCQQRQCDRFKACESFCEIRAELSVDEGKQILVVFRLDQYAGAGLPERAREHRQRGGGKIRELAAKFLLVARDHCPKRLAGIDNDVPMASLGAMDVINVPHQGGVPIVLQEARPVLGVAAEKRQDFFGHRLSGGHGGNGEGAVLAAGQLVGQAGDRAQLGVKHRSAGGQFNL